jgi:hypothetical protein
VTKQVALGLPLLLPTLLPLLLLLLLLPPPLLLLNRLAVRKGKLSLVTPHTSSHASCPARIKPSILHAPASSPPQGHASQSPASPSS